jgi:hypothetical protein
MTIRRRPPRLRITTDEQQYPILGDVSAFLYDLTIVHDRLVLLSSGDSRAGTSRRFFVNRLARSYVPQEQRIRLHSLGMGSPIVVEVLLAAQVPGAVVAVGWGLHKLLEKIQDIHIKGEQRESLRLRNIRARQELAEITGEIAREFHPVAQQPTRRLLSSEQPRTRQEDRTPEELLTDDATQLASNPSVLISQVEQIEDQPR